MNYSHKITMRIMAFPEWITQKFIEWRGSKITGASVAAYAKEVGVSQQLMSEWMTGKKIPGRKTLTKLAQRYPDVYDILDLETASEFDGLPANIQERLRQATEEVNTEFIRRGLTGEMPEAEALTIQIFEKWGFKYTDTTTAEED